MDPLVLDGYKPWTNHRTCRTRFRLARRL